MEKYNFILQVYEMYVAGYSFYLLNNAFTNHWGFQSLKTRPQWRARQQEQNNARFDEFAKEVGFLILFLFSLILCDQICAHSTAKRIVFTLL